MNAFSAFDISLCFVVFVRKVKTRQEYFDEYSKCSLGWSCDLAPDDAKKKGHIGSRRKYSVFLMQLLSLMILQLKHSEEFSRKLNWLSLKYCEFILWGETIDLICHIFCPGKSNCPSQKQNLCGCRFTQSYRCVWYTQWFLIESNLHVLLNVTHIVKQAVNWNLVNLLNLFFDHQTY